MAATAAEFERDVERLVRFVTRQRATETENESANNLEDAPAPATTLLEDVTEMLSHKIDDERLWDLVDIRPVSEPVRIADASMSIVEAPVPLRAVDVLVDDATWRRLETALGPLANFDFVAWRLVPAGGMPAGVVADTASSDIDLFLVGHTCWDECERAVDAVARHLRAELVRRYRARTASERAAKHDRRAPATETGAIDGAIEEKRPVAATTLRSDVAASGPLSAMSANLSADSMRNLATSETTRAIVAAAAEAKGRASTADPLQKNESKGGAEEKEEEEEERDDEKCHDLDVRRTIGCCTFASVREKFVVQIVLKRYASTEDVLGGFDNGSCSVALVERTGSDECCGVEHRGVVGGGGADEKQATVVASPPIASKKRGRLVTSRRGRVSYKWRTNYVDLRCRRVTFETRYLKYQARGWHLALPESCAARIQPGIRYLDMQYMTLCVDYMRDNCVRTRAVCYRQPDGGRRGTFEVYCGDPERCAHAAHHILSVTYRDAGVQRRHALRRAAAWRSAQRWREALRETKRRSGGGAHAESTSQQAVMPPPAQTAPPTVTLVRVEASATRGQVKPRNWFLDCRASDDGESSESADQGSDSEDVDDDDKVDSGGGETVDDEKLEADGGDGRQSLSVDIEATTPTAGGNGGSPAPRARAPERAHATSSPTSAEDENEDENEEEEEVAELVTTAAEKRKETKEGGAAERSAEKGEDGVAATSEPGTDEIDAAATNGYASDDPIESCAGNSDDALTRPIYDVYGYNYLAATQYQSASNYAAVRLRGAQSVHSVVACARYVLGMRCTAVQSLFTDLHLVVAKYLAYPDDDVAPASAVADARQRRRRRRLIEESRDEWRQENMAHLERILGRDETTALVELLARHPTKLEAVVGRLAQAAAAVVQIPPATDRVHDAHLEALFGDLTARLFSRWCHAPTNPSGPESPLCDD